MKPTIKCVMIQTSHSMPWTLAYLEHSVPEDPLRLKSTGHTSPLGVSVVSSSHGQGRDSPGNYCVSLTASPVP